MFTRNRAQKCQEVARAVVVYRNPSATISVWEAGSKWALVVGEHNGDEARFSFSTLRAANGATEWLAYRRLSGLVSAGMTWAALVDAVHDSDPAAAASAAVSPVSAVEQWKATASLSERLRESDGPELAEFFLRSLVGSAELREDTLSLLAELESVS